MTRIFWAIKTQKELLFDNFRNVFLFFIFILNFFLLDTFEHIKFGKLKLFHMFRFGVNTGYEIMSN